MSRFSIQFNNKQNISYTEKIENIHPKSFYFNKNMNYYICSSGGCGSTIIYNYLSNFGNVFHCHDRYPPDELEYIGKNHDIENSNDEWFNGIKVPEQELTNYKVIFIYRYPIPVIFSRFTQRNGPNINHLKNIKCDNNGNINFFDVLKSKKDLYKMEEFFDNYTLNISNKNYDIYCIKYEMFWNNISFFNKIMNIPDIKYLYPTRIENKKKQVYVNELTSIYKNLINKMNHMAFIKLIRKNKINENK